MDVGAHLRSARERRGLTLEQVASSTKLSTSVLRHIERNEWERLPGGLLTRGHLRAYAVAVGLDPELLVHEYSSQLPPEVVKEPRPAPVPITDSGPAVRPLLTAMLGLVVTLGAYSWITQPKAPTGTTTGPGRSPVANEPPMVRPDAADPAPAVMEDPQGPRLSLEIDATGPCWVSARADGRLVVYRLLEAGEAVTVAANEVVVLRIGDPGRFRYRLNGVPGRALGDGREPVTVTITQGNSETLQIRELAATAPKPMS